MSSPYKENAPVKDGTRVRLGICLSDGELYRHLARMAQLWAQEMCVRLDVFPVPEDGPGDASLLIFAASGDNEAIGQWAAQRRREGHAAALVALVDNSRQAIASYRHHPSALLQKDAGYGELSAALNRCFPAWSQGMVCLDILCQREWMRVPLSQVRYIEARGRGTCLQCANGSFEANKSLGQLAQILPQPPFLRCQKSFLVHLSAVEQIRNGVLVMSDGQEISISRRLLPEVRRKVEQWNSRF